MSKMRNKTISQTIEKIIKAIDDTNLSFDEKRFLMIQSIKRHYSKDSLSTAEIIERKNTIENMDAVENQFLMPFFVGALSSLLTQGFVETFKVLRVEEALVQFILNCIAVGIFTGIFCLVWRFIIKLLSTRKRYTRYYLFDHELEIIDMVLEARNLLQCKNKELLKSNQK